MKNLICVVTIMLITLSAYATTLVVDQLNGPDYFTINAAYDAAVDGDTILIYPATYLESISISKAITLKGIDPKNTIIRSNVTTIIIYNGLTIIEGITVIGLNKGIYIRSSTPVIQNCIIEQSDIGIHIYEEECIIINCIIRNCVRGIRIRKNSDGLIANNVIYGCSSAGIFLYAPCCATVGIDVNLYNNIIINNHYGFDSDHINSNGYVNYNCFDGNDSNLHTTYSNVTLGPENIYQNPLFVNSAESNYYLQGGSLCIDTGNPEIEHDDLDGTRNDMGIFGGPQQWGSGNPTVMDIQITPESVTPGETFDIEATGQVK